MSSERRYPDPASLPPHKRPGVRLHRHEPDRLWPWVFTQQEIWVDVHGHEHPIESMPGAYVANVIAFCQQHARRIYTLCHDEPPLPDPPTAATTDRDALLAWLAALDEQARVWLDATPLLQALGRRLGET